MLYIMAQQIEIPQFVFKKKKIQNQNHLNLCQEVCQIGYTATPPA